LRETEDEIRIGVAAALEARRPEAPLACGVERRRIETRRGVNTRASATAPLPVTRTSIIATPPNGAVGGNTGSRMVVGYATSADTGPVSFGRSPCVAPCSAGARYTAATITFEGILRAVVALPSVLIDSSVAGVKRQKRTLSSSNCVNGGVLRSALAVFTVPLASRPSSTITWPPPTAIGARPGVAPPSKRAGV